MYRSSTTQNLIDLDIDLSRTFKANYHGVVGFPIYDFLVVFNNNMWPNLTPFRVELSHQNLISLNFDL